MRMAISASRAFRLKEGAGVNTAEGAVKVERGMYSEAIVADVAVFYKDGNQIAETTGLTTDISEGGKAKFHVYLLDGEDFLNKEQVDSIASYQINHVSTVEDIQALSAQKAKEAEEAEAELKAKYPDEIV